MKPRPPVNAHLLTKRAMSKGPALPAATTKAHASTDGLVPEPPPPPPPPPQVDEAPLPPEPAPAPAKPTSSGWGMPLVGWWSRPDGYDTAAQSTPLPGTPPPEDSATAPVATAEPTLGPVSVSANVPKAASMTPDDKPSDSSARADNPQDTPANSKRDIPASPSYGTSSSSSWFWLWSSAHDAQYTLPSPKPADDPSKQTITQQPPAEQPPAEQPPAEQPPADDIAQKAAASSSKPSSWAFWYSDKSSSREPPTDGEARKHVGEVAVLDTPSQNHPEVAQFNEQDQPQEQPHKQPQRDPPKESLAKRSFASLRGRRKARSTASETLKNTPASSKATTPTQTSPTREALRTEHASPKTATPPASPATASTPKTANQASSAKQEPSNLILPEFRTTYRLAQHKNFWKQVRQYFLGGEPSMPHLHVNPAPPRISKAVAIGVHGFFPAPIFQRIMGQPTGTSIRFAGAAATAIKEWCEVRGYEPEIEQVALEGEGFIAERVNNLWKLLLNWIEQIKAADFIMVACHSQGVPVAIMLMAKLIQFGCISPTAKVGICAMAGVNMGPFIEYKTKYFGPTAAELFEFSNPQSLVSQMYLAALDEVLRFGVKILYVGSIDDQLVSLESSTFSTLSHPYIYRAVFVDGRIHAPDFLTHLVGFTLKMRNLGLPDHGLIRELSPALAGSLYGGEGHSRVYEDPAVYALAIQHALETTTLPVQPQPRPSSSSSFQGINIPVIGDKLGSNTGRSYQLRVRNYEAPATAATQNPYFLPWAMRGLLEEDFVKKELGAEVEELLGMFEEWKPTAKQLKDVKFRLEGVRSKL